MGNSNLKIRTKDYALSVIRLFAELPKNRNANHRAAVTVVLRVLNPVAYFDEVKANG
jgi:hypothetical protein